MAEEFEGPTSVGYGGAQHREQQQRQQQLRQQRQERQEGRKGTSVSLWTLPWFHGRLDQKEAESLLLENGADDGLFLVRIPPTRSAYVISVAHRGRLQHFLVNRNEDKLLILPENPDGTFPDISAVVRFFKEEAHGRPGPLMLPCPRSHMPPQQQQQPYEAAVADIGANTIQQNKKSETRTARPNPFSQAGVACPPPVSGRKQQRPQRPQQRQRPGSDQPRSQSVSARQHQMRAVSARSGAAAKKQQRMSQPTEQPRQHRHPPPPHLHHQQPQRHQQHQRSTPSSARSSERPAGPRPVRLIGQQQRQRQVPASSPDARQATGHHAPAAQHGALEAPQVDDSIVRSFTISEPISQREGGRSGAVAKQRGTLTGLHYSSPTTITPGKQYNPSGRELLLCEGYLSKLRGALQNKSRWFVLTTHRISFYVANAGKWLSGVNLRDILHIEDLGGRKFRVATRVQFGTSKQFDMLLEASSTAAKQKWMRSFVMDASQTAGFNSDNAELIVEGPLTKVQPLGSASRTRWFRLTTKKFAYFEKEGGEELGAAHMDIIVEIALLASDREFTVSTLQPFTKSGAFEVRCRCESAAVRDKWITGLRRVLPTVKFVECRK